MKQISLFILSVSISLITASCSTAKEKSPEELLEDPKTRNEILDVLISNRSYSANLIEKMMANEQIKTMLAETPLLVKAVCLSPKTDSLTDNDKQVIESMTNRMIKQMEMDSDVCDKTCTRLIESENIRRYMDLKKYGKGPLQEKKK